MDGKDDTSDYDKMIGTLVTLMKWMAKMTLVTDEMDGKDDNGETSDDDNSGLDSHDDGGQGSDDDKA